MYVEGNEIHQVLQGKVEFVVGVRNYLEERLRKRSEKDRLTIEGGLFALRTSAPTPNKQFQTGTLGWILDRRQLIESFVSEDVQEEAFIKDNSSLTDIAVEVESGQIASDEELAHRLLIYCNNRILADQLPEQHISLIAAIKDRLL